MAAYAKYNKIIDKQEKYVMEIFIHNSEKLHRIVKPSLETFPRCNIWSHENKIKSKIHEQFENYVNRKFQYGIAAKFVYSGHALKQASCSHFCFKLPVYFS